jgi:mannose-1-phosphate guanylyltransferase/phosphomannomutase
MAGGEGSRLRPLTCSCPKPMVPVVNRPIMAHIVDLLITHDFTEIGATLQYMPGVIRDYFEHSYVQKQQVRISYFIEDKPLGTAGSVKNTRDFIQGTFLVISGDALTDLDLTAAVNFHRQKGAMATLVLTKVKYPLEYGVVITDREGRITQFLEKPAWGEVFSDTVNTGIYVLEPEVLNYFDQEHFFDFSKNLFPLLLKEKQPLFGLTLPGYWCDIGSLEQYLQANYAVLSHQTKIKAPGQEIAPRVWVEKGAEINPGANICGPALIGENCRIGPRVEIEPLTIIGSGCLIQERANLKRSVLWRNIFLGSGSALRGVILCDRVRAEPDVAIYEGAVVGSDSIIKKRSVIKPDVKLWPCKTVEAQTVVKNSLIWGTRTQKYIFGLEGITGLFNIEVTPELALRAGAAFASLQGNKNNRFSVGSDHFAASIMLKEAAAAGIQSTGARVFNLGPDITPLHRFAVRHLNLAGGIHIKTSPLNDQLITMVFLDRQGSNISRDTERKVENLYRLEDFPRVDAGHVQFSENVQNIAEEYIHSLLQEVDLNLFQRKKFRLVVSSPHALKEYINPLARALNIEVRYLPAAQTGSEKNNHFSKGVKFNALTSLTYQVLKEQAFAGVILDHNGEQLILVDEYGQVIQDGLLTSLIALIVFKTYKGPVVVPVTASQAIESLAQRYQGQVVRTKTAVQDFMAKLSGQNKVQFRLNFDALGALIHILEFSALNNLSLGALVDEIPAFFTKQKDVFVPWEMKGQVIRHLIEEPPIKEMELLDGVKIFHPQGWALILPDAQEPVCRIFSEGASMEIAQSLADFYFEKISQMVQNNARS